MYASRLVWKEGEVSITLVVVVMSVITVMKSTKSNIFFIKLYNNQCIKSPIQFSLNKLQSCIV